jgi:hypothetical protein
MGQTRRGATALLPAQTHARNAFIIVQIMFTPIRAAAASVFARRQSSVHFSGKLLINNRHSTTAHLQTVGKGPAGAQRWHKVVMSTHDPIHGSIHVSFKLVTCAMQASTETLYKWVKSIFGVNTQLEPQSSQRAAYV